MILLNHKLRIFISKNLLRIKGPDIKMCINLSTVQPTNIRPFISMGLYDIIHQNQENIFVLHLYKTFSILCCHPVTMIQREWG